jgi:hypothetical protein
LECVYFAEPPHAVVLFDGSSVDSSSRVNDSLTPVAPSLEDRLVAWLGGVDHKTTVPDEAVIAARVRSPMDEPGRSG